MATAPSVPDIATGILPSSTLAQLAECIAFLMAPPRAKMRQTSTQNLSTATWTSITFTTEDYDTDPSGAGGHSNSSNTSRYTAVYAGWYLVSGGVTFAANATGIRAARWAVNGSALDGTQATGQPVSGLPHSVAARAEAVYLNVGDYVELQGYQSSGGVLATVSSGDSQSSMTVRWQSAA